MGFDDGFQLSGSAKLDQTQEMNRGWVCQTKLRQKPREDVGAAPADGLPEPVDIRLTNIGDIRHEVGNIPLGIRILLLHVVG